MIRALVAAFTVACVVVVPAAAQDAVPPAGRFQLTPGQNSSFIRLDTRTGAVSHCRQDAGVWRCEPIMDSGLADRLTTLSDKVDRLSAGLERLSLRVDALAAGRATPIPPGSDSAVGKNGTKPTGFAQTAVYRLMEMIRTLKHGRADQT